MKNFLILLLTVMLATGAVMSRPGEESFRSHVRRQVAAASVPGVLSLSDRQIEQATQGCVFKDRYLWSVVEVNGRVAFAGVFSRWFAVPESAEKGVEGVKETVRERAVETASAAGRVVIKGR